MEDKIADEYFGYFKNVLSDNLQALSSSRAGPFICVENYRIGRIAMAALSAAFKASDRVAPTLDIPKIMLNFREPDNSILNFFRQNSRRIREIRVHDMNPDGISHLSPGQGAIDFSPFRDFLRTGDCWVTVEVRPAKKAAESISWLRHFANDSRGDH